MNRPGRAARLALSAALTVWLGLTTSIAVADGPAPPIPADTWKAYRESIQDAAVATPKEISTTLLSIVPDGRYLQWREIGGEQYVLVQTMRRDALGQPGQTVPLSNDRWLTIPGQMDQLCRSAKCSKLGARKLALRLKQMSGLPPDGDYHLINTFWVKPSDLFRPCTDPRIDTTTCPIEVPSGGPVPAQVGGTDIAKFLWNQAAYALRMPAKFNASKSVSCAVDWTTTKCYGFPWTRLGYVYDWNPDADEMGLSEFVAVKNAQVVIEKVETQRQAYPRR